MLNPSDKPQSPSALPSRKILIRGIQGFVFFFAVGAALSMWWKRPAGLEEILATLEWRYMLMLLPLIALDYVVGGLRYRLFFTGKILPYVSLWDCMRSNWANMFMGAITPFQTGGGPAQLYFLWRKGVPITHGLLVSSVNFGATMFFFMISSLLALQWIPPDFLGKSFTPVFQTGFAAIAGITGAIVVLLFFPFTGYHVIRRMFLLLPLRGERTLGRRDRILLKTEEEIHRFAGGFRSILRRSKGTLILTVVATIILFSNKYVMGYIVARGMGQVVPFDIFFGLQIVQLLLIYFAPTPGGSGLAELSAVWLMGKLMPESILLVYAVLWRFCTTIFGAVIGGVVLLQELNKAGKEAEAT